MGVLQPLPIVICISVYSMALLAIYADVFLVKTHDINRTALAWSVFVIWQYIINADAYKMASSINLMITLLSICIVCFAAYYGSVVRKAIFSVTYLAFWMVLESLSWAMLLQVYQKEPPKIATSLLSKTIFLIVIIGIRYYMKRNDNNRVYINIKKSILLLPLCSIILCYIFYEIGREAGTYKAKVRIIMIVGTTILVMANLSFYFLYARLIDMRQMKVSSQNYLNQMEMYRQQRETDKRVMNEVQEERHNIKHKFILLQELAVREGSKRIEDEIQRLSNDSIKKIDRTIQTGVMSIDAIINHKKMEAELKGITFKTNLLVNPCMLISDIDLCVLLGNSLDNAIEATDHVTNGIKTIDVNMNYNKGVLVIKIINPYQGSLEWMEAGKRIKTRKTEGTHGLGLYSISKIVSEYHGDMKIETDNEMFILNILMYG